MKCAVFRIIKIFVWSTDEWNPWTIDRRRESVKYDDTLERRRDKKGGEEKKRETEEELGEHAEGPFYLPLMWSVAWA